nr:dynein axonemal intermediate chain 4-like [Procambarus clarkii]
MTEDLQQQQQQEERVEVGGARGVEVGGARGVEVGGLLRGLGWVERQLSSSVNLHLLHAYTDYAHQRKEGPKSGAEACESGGCQAEELWHFRCEATSGCRVNGITFCSSSPWLVVAAYGSPSLTNHSGGALCGWSAKRIGQPEVRVPLPGPATVVSSCPAAPQLCCVALLDGTLLVYQLDTPAPQLVMDTSGSVAKHCAPVWAVEWRQTFHTMPARSENTHTSDAHVDDGCVDDDQDHEIPGDDIHAPTTNSQVWHKVGIQALVSASEDGTVKEWLFSKTSLIRCTTLMRVCVPPWVSLEIAGGLGGVLRRPEESRIASTGPWSSRGGNGQLLPESVPATALKFRPGDNTSYLLGTVAGHLLMCRTFERRGSVAVFRGHTGLVTALDWRPPPPADPATHVFLSAALDDSIRVWHMDKQEPHCVLRNPQVRTSPDGYVDACWCPWYSNLIAGVHSGGLHLWDISLSTHTPILTYPHPGATCVTFSPHTRNVVLGEEGGSLSVIHLTGLAVHSSTAFHRLSSVLSRITKLGIRADDEEEEEE